MDLQQLVDDLAHDLGRSVVINDLDFKPIAASAQGDDLDSVRVDSLLQRSTPSPAVAYLRELGLESARSSRRIPLTRFGGLERLVTPIRVDGETLAYLWLIVENKPELTQEQLRMMSSTVESAGSVLSGRPIANRFLEIAAHLLDDDREASREALADALDSRMLDPALEVSCIVLLVAEDDDIAGLSDASLSRQLSTAAAHAAYVVQRAPGRLTLAVSGLAGPDYFAAFGTVLRRAGSAVRGTGASRHDGVAGDLIAAADRAAVAARFSRALPGYRDGVRYEDLGVLTLTGVDSTRLERVRQISPAAAGLLAGSKDVQRETVLAYLEAGGDARRTCDALRIHRTTLYYRLDHLDPVVRDALADGWARTSMHVALRFAELLPAERAH
jgi:hypothetical protein